MLLDTKQLLKSSVRSRDGSLGAIRDLFFDDASWTIRYLVVDTGRFFTGRRILLSPEAINRAEWLRREAQDDVSVDLTHEQLRNSPSVDADRPVSRQQEERMRRYYGWPLYWSTPMYGGLYPAAGMTMAAQPATPAMAVTGPAAAPQDAGAQPPRGDPNLRSVREVMGYTVSASDGQIGHVEDLMVHDGNWQIAYLIVDTRNWWPGRKVLVSPAWVHEITWTTSTVQFGVERDRIRGAPEYDTSRPLTADAAARLHDYYGRPRYGEW